MKDNFSRQAERYARFRPKYPQELFDFILSLVRNRDNAWDCGTGNGQVALELSRCFKRVYATDVSDKQLENAVVKSNIIYKVEQAEKSSFPDNEFDLITVAQAIHWFDFSKFYTEVDRTLRPEGIIAVMGYALCRVDDTTDKIIDRFDNEILRPYWDDERHYIDERYETIPFPYDELKVPEFSASYRWSLEELLGFFNTWSAVQHSLDQTGNSPVDGILRDLRTCWREDERKTVTFPILLRVGRMKGKGELSKKRDAIPDVAIVPGLQSNVSSHGRQNNNGVER